MVASRRRTMLETAMTRWLDLGSSERFLPLHSAADRTVAEISADRRRAGRPIAEAGGHASALRTLIASERDRGTNVLRPATALSARYPRASREKRLLDAMPLSAPR